PRLQQYKSYVFYRRQKWAAHLYHKSSVITLRLGRVFGEDLIAYRLSAKSSSPEMETFGQPVGLSDRPFSNDRPGPLAGCFCSEFTAMPISSCVPKRPIAGRHLAVEYDGNLAILRLVISDIAANSSLLHSSEVP